MVSNINKHTLIAWCQLLRLDKPIGNFLCLWPTLWALWLASGGFPALYLLLIFTLGALFMRAAGCVINDIFDRRLDATVLRTQQRPLATGQLSLRCAWLSVVGLLVLAASLLFWLNSLTVLLAIVVALLAGLYPLAKRVIDLPQLHLGLVFNAGVLMAFTAVQNQLPLTVWWLYLGCVSWTMAYDTLYAMVDRDDDLSYGAKSSAIFFGDYDLIAVGVCQALFLLLLSVTGYGYPTGPLGGCFWLALLLVAGLMGYQLWQARTRARSDCFWAFLNNHWVGLVLFVGISLSLW